MSGAARDLAHALRTVARTPLLSIVVVVSLALGVGLNAVVFSWIQARMLRPLPGVPDSARFYGIEPRSRLGQYPGASWLEYQDLRRTLRLVEEPIASRMAPLYVGEPGRVERLSGAFVSENYFSGLGLRPAAGRFPRATDAPVGSESVAVISDGLWERLFRRQASAIGSTLRVNARQLTIVAVAPAEFRGTVPGLYVDIWMPAPMVPELLNGSAELVDRSVRGYLMLARLRGGVTTAQAQAELDAATLDLARAHPDTNDEVHAEIVPFWNLPRGPSRMLNTALLILQGTMLLVLLAVCGNIATLMLARASTRSQEVAVRMTSGASPWQIARIIALEALVLAAAGASLGVLVAVWGTNALRVLPMTGLPLRLETSLDAAGVALSVVLALVAGVLIGAAPAAQFWRVDPQCAVRAGATTSARSRLRDGLMALQMALALMVLIAAGISLRRYVETRATDPGFRRDGVTLAAYDLAGRAVNTAAARTFTSDLLDRLRRLPGVEAAAVAAAVPLDIHGLPMRIFTVEGRTRTEPGDDSATTNTVTPGYFEVMGIPLVAGRDFSALTDPAAPPEAVVNQEFVRQFLVGGEPVGRRVMARARSHTIVGVVRNSVSNAFGEPPTPVIYFSYRDAPQLRGEIHVRARPGAEAALAGDVRAAVRQLDTDVPVFNVRALHDHVESNLVLRRIPARMFAVIGPLLLGLATLGVYAAAGYSASLRRSEVGVRLALGATPPNIVRQFVREQLLVVGAGGAIGWTLAFALTRWLLPQPIDVPVFAGVPLVLLLVAMAAAWAPARAASRLDPSAALGRE